MFNINQKVVCVDADFSKVPTAFRKYYSAFPKRDRIYTIRDIVPGMDGEVACHLHEIHNPPNQKGTENGYNVERFVPLDSTPEETEEYTVASLTL